MGTIDCKFYERFQISGVNLGVYKFDVNPSSYDPFPAKTTQFYKSVNSFNSTVDQVYTKIELTMGWDIMQESMWNDLLPYYRKNTDGTSEGLYFYDSNIGNFNWTKIQVIDLRAQAMAGNDPIYRTKVSFRIRQII